MTVNDGRPPPGGLLFARTARPYPADKSPILLLPLRVNNRSSASAISAWLVVSSSAAIMRSWRSTCGGKCPPTITVLSRYLPDVSAAGVALFPVLAAGAGFVCFFAVTALPCPAGVCFFTVALAFCFGWAGASGVSVAAPASAACSEFPRLMPLPLQVVFLTVAVGCIGVYTYTRIAPVSLLPPCRRVRTPARRDLRPAIGRRLCGCQR